MPWTYSQSSGKLLLNETLIATGYSGHEEGLNNPALQNEAQIGPIPQGAYTIGPVTANHPGKGPIVMELIPRPGTQVFGRSGFLIHGDNQALDRGASHGCIILDRLTREKVAASADRNLVVTR
jgi:hypothetical protein